MPRKYDNNLERRWNVLMKIFLGSNIKVTMGKRYGEGNRDYFDRIRLIERMEGKREKVGPRQDVCRQFLTTQRGEYWKSNL
jgi:hypothetical protein